jgi:hypothetical protein
MVVVMSGREHEAMRAEQTFTWKMSHTTRMGDESDRKVAADLVVFENS